MFHLRYDHQTEKKPRFGEIYAVFAEQTRRVRGSVFALAKARSHTIIEVFTSGKSLRFVQVSFSLIHVLPPNWATYDMVGMYALIVVHRGSDYVSVCLLLDQIKPIGQLVPVN